MANHSSNPNDPITDYSQTQRVVLLIDLSPLISLRNPSQFLSSLLCSAKTLLSFPPLSTSLFAFKFFFSPLSPLLSSSKVRSLVPTSPISLSFDRQTPTLQSLSQTLNSLSSFGDEPPEGCSPRASCLAASMRQLVHDYAWDPIIRDSVTGTLLNSDPVVVRSNLVVLFLSICTSFESLSEFLNVGINDDCFGNVSTFCERFCGFFGNVSEAFARRDIQLSWINVQCGINDDGENNGGNESKLGFEFLESGISNLGWGFCSTDAIILGSAIVPFGLIYPKIGISPSSFGFDDCLKELRAQLSLDILDVAQKPLECNCCDLVLVDTEVLPRNRSNNDVLHLPEIMNSQRVGIELKKKLWGCFSDGVNKLQVKALHKNDEFSKFKGNLSNPILVREVPLKPGRDRKENSDEFFADKVLRMIGRELGDFMPRKSAPIWQILLSFLYREGYCALVTVSNPGGSSLRGIFKPFTVSSALLYITDDAHDFAGADVVHFDKNTSNEASQPIKCSDRDSKKLRRRKNLKLIQDQTWSSFCTAAFECSELKLEEVYFSRQCSNSKKLRFLKCWMKQITKSSSNSLVSREKLNPVQQEAQRDADEILTEVHQESERPISSASAGENSLTGACRYQDAAITDYQSETSETFLNNLSNKIQQGLESEAVDLGALAQRLVNSAIYWLNRKCDAETTDSQVPVPKSQDSTGGSLGAELLQLFLRDPKDLIAKGRNNDPPSQAPEGPASEKIVREYELQILFRMEILQSEVGESIGDSMKQKFVKQICLLLETIQCHLEGGFFGDWSLDNYVGKIIKSRYSDTLEHVVHKIYKKMDLLLFADEDEPPNRFLNSEDSNQSLREKLDKDEHDNLRVSEPVSTDESLQPLENNDRIQGSTQEEHARKLIEAQERRERARRFTAFTSWVPDLQRVWAPKQPKAMNPKSDPHRKMSKRKKHAEEVNDMVCETPMTENKHSHSQRSYDNDEDYPDKDYSKQSCPSVPKALFQDDR